MCQAELQAEVMDELLQREEMDALDAQIEMDKDRDIKIIDDPLFLMMIDLMRRPLK